MLLKWKDYLNTKKLVLGSSSLQRKQILTALNINYTTISSNFPENLPKTKNTSPLTYVEQTSYHKLLEIIESNPTTSIDILITVDTIVVLQDKILEKAEDANQAFEWLLSYSGQTLEVISAVCLALVRNTEKKAIKVLENKNCDSAELDLDYIRGNINNIKSKEEDKSMNNFAKENNKFECKMNDLSKEKVKNDSIDDKIISKENKKDKECLNEVVDFLMFTERTKVKMMEYGKDEVRSYVQTGEWFGRAGAIAVQLIGKVLVERVEGCYYNVVGLPIAALGKNLDLLLSRNGCDWKCGS